MAARALITIWQEEGAAAVAAKMSAAARAGAPLLLRRRRTAAGVGAYFDLITDDGRRYYGDSFHFGYFPTGSETLAEAHDAHTDLVAAMARVRPGHEVLDVGCGVGAPAIRIASRHDCRITGINISREQVRQGLELVASERMGERVRIEHGDARALRFADESFDALICLEVAGDVCVVERDKQRLVRELRRVLRPGGHVGFSDLALRSAPRGRDERVLRSVLYHRGAELVTDWPAIFAANGFEIVEQRCIIEQVMPTWAYTRALCEGSVGELARRYGRRIAARASARVERIPAILAAHASFPVLSARRIG